MFHLTRFWQLRPVWMKPATCGARFGKQFRAFFFLQKMGRPHKGRYQTTLLVWLFQFKNECCLGRKCSTPSYKSEAIKWLWSYAQPWNLHQMKPPWLCFQFLSVTLTKYWHFALILFELVSFVLLWQQLSTDMNAVAFAVLFCLSSFSSVCHVFSLCTECCL